MSHRETIGEAAEFFEAQVRPVLAEHCFGCHGPKRQRAGLRLDAQIYLLQGGDSGPAIVLRDPEQSELIRAIRYDGEVQMPPKGKLPDNAVAALTEWVKMGAPWPESKAASPIATGTDAVAAARKKHWSFQPVREPVIHAVQESDWPTSPIDYFVLAKLQANGMTPAKPADRRTLIRRVTFDLIGLPPTPEEVEAFASDPSPEAFATVVDRLLASPHYGERWGRYWLDVARYADTKGYVYDGEERRYPFSYTYRDYVIRAFNDDVPYDRFLVEQIAGDFLPRGEDRRFLAAMGFLMLGRRFVNNMHDVIDDRLDVIFRGTQALTVSCARCHDHKFDPIPMRDYYSLYGVMASSTEKTVQLVAPRRTAAYLAYESELRSRESARNQKIEDARRELSERLRRKVSEYLVAVLDADNQPGDDFYVILSANDVNPVIVRRWQSYMLRTRKGFHRVFGPWHAFAAIPAGEFAARAPELARQFASGAAENEVSATCSTFDSRRSEQQLNALVADAFDGSPPASMREVAKRYGRLLEAAHETWCDLLETAVRNQTSIPLALPDPAQEELRQVLYAANSPTTVPPIRINEIETLFDESTRVALNQAQAEVDRWNLQSAEAPPQARILEDSPIPYDPHVLIQGNPKLKGEEVERQFLEVLAGEDREPFQQGSGRLEMAQAIASRENPLTARVMANRIWQHHFGAGLVGSPSNFGLSGETPTHPELLDYMAWRFMEDGWSIKKLHRLILLSSTYQQSSAHNPRFARKDPENHLLWRMNRRRLDFEATRDSLLATSGRLDATMGGRPLSLTDSLFPTRRTIYGFVDRQNFPSLFATFDFANPDQHSPERHITTVPQQALFLMNSPFVMEQAQSLAARSDVAAYLQTERRIRQLYSIVYQRAPTERELGFGLRFLPSAMPAQRTGIGRTDAPLTAWERYAQALLLANEFVMVD